MPTRPVLFEDNIDIGKYYAGHIYDHDDDHGYAIISGYGNLTCRVTLDPGITRTLEQSMGDTYIILITRVDASDDKVISRMYSDVASNTSDIEGVCMLDNQRLDNFRNLRHRYERIHNVAESIVKQTKNLVQADVYKSLRAIFHNYGNTWVNYLDPYENHEVTTLSLRDSMSVALTRIMIHLNTMHPNMAEICAADEKTDRAILENRVSYLIPAMERVLPWLFNNTMDNIREMFRSWIKKDIQYQDSCYIDIMAGVFRAMMLNAHMFGFFAKLKIRAKNPAIVDKNALEGIIENHYNIITKEKTYTNSRNIYFSRRHVKIEINSSNIDQDSAIADVYKIFDDIKKIEIVRGCIGSVVFSCESAHTCVKY